MEKENTTSFNSLTLETLKGCGKDVFIKPLTRPIECGNIFSSEEGWVEKQILCPICKAKAQTLLDAGKDELEFLSSLSFNEVSIPEFRSILVNRIKNRITQLSQDIKLLEDNLK